MNVFCCLILNEEKHHESVPVFLIIYRHVVFPVTLNALDEVLHGFIYVTIHVIWAPKFYLLQRIVSCGVKLRKLHPSHFKHLHKNIHLLLTIP